MTQQTPLYAQHCQLGGLMVDFAGWQMPLHYGSQMAEHHAVRRGAGMFDVSHMGVVDIEGSDVAAFLRKALANDIRKLDQDGKALYSCMLNTNGGVIDDLIVYRLKPQMYRVVINASRRAADLAWLRQLAADFQIRLQERPDLAMLAVQGPQALAKLSSLFSKPLFAAVNVLKPFTCVMHHAWQMARTGYTGEDGVEMILPANEVVKLWQDLLELNVQPCGLGARDTLRLEAGLNLYGADMDETTTPLESNLAWTIDWQDPLRDFVGRAALEQQKKAGIQRRLIGLIMTEGGVLRNHQRVYINGQDVGEITSGSFSPTLEIAIALARVPVGTATDAMVERRGKMIAVQFIKTPFVKHGTKTFVHTVKEQA